jgi:DNA gyrase/topoisomerase IV subunit A
MYPSKSSNVHVGDKILCRIDELHTRMPLTTTREICAQVCIQHRISKSLILTNLHLSAKVSVKTIVKMFQLINTKPTSPEAEVIMKPMSILVAKMIDIAVQATCKEIQLTLPVYQQLVQRSYQLQQQQIGSFLKNQLEKISLRRTSSIQELQLQLLTLDSAIARQVQLFQDEMQEIAWKFLDNAVRKVEEMVTALQLNLRHAWVHPLETIDPKINQEDKEQATDTVVATLATGTAKEINVSCSSKCGTEGMQQNVVHVQWVKYHTTLAFPQYSIQWISALLLKFFGVVWDSWRAKRCSQWTWDRLAA